MNELGMKVDRYKLPPAPPFDPRMNVIGSVLGATAGNTPKPLSPFDDVHDVAMRADTLANLADQVKYQFFAETSPDMQPSEPLLDGTLPRMKQHCRTAQSSLDRVEAVLRRLLEVAP